MEAGLLSIAAISAATTETLEALYFEISVELRERDEMLSLERKEQEEAIKRYVCNNSKS